MVYDSELASEVLQLTRIFWEIITMRDSGFLDVLPRCRKDSRKNCIGSYLTQFFVVSTLKVWSLGVVFRPICG